MVTHQFLCVLNCMSAPNSHVPRENHRDISSGKNQMLQAWQKEGEEFTTSHLPKLTMKGDTVSTKISQDGYSKELEECKTHLHGRLIMGKRDKPWITRDLAKKLNDLWLDMEEWKIVPLCKGFSEFLLINAEDMRKVWAIGSHNLKPFSL